MRSSLKPGSFNVSVAKSSIKLSWVALAARLRQPRYPTATSERMGLSSPSGRINAIEGSRVEKNLSGKDETVAMRSLSVQSLPNNIEFSQEANWSRAQSSKSSISVINFLSLNPISSSPLAFCGS